MVEHKRVFIGSKRLRLLLLGMGKVLLVGFSCDWRVISATDMSDQGGCSCVQDISAILCEENIMFWEVSGIGAEVILSRVISLSDCTL